MEDERADEPRTSEPNGPEGPPELAAPPPSPPELGPLWKFLHLSLVGLGILIVIGGALAGVSEDGLVYGLGRLLAILAITGLIRFLFVKIVDRSARFWRFSLVGIAVLLTFLARVPGAMERSADLQESPAREWVAPARAFRPLDGLTYRPVAPGLAATVRRSFASTEDGPGAAPKSAVRALYEGRKRVAIVVALSFPPAARADREATREGFFRGFVDSAGEPTSPLVDPRIDEIEIDGEPAVLVVTESVSVVLAFDHEDFAVQLIGADADALRDAATELISSS